MLFGYVTLPRIGPRATGGPGLIGAPQTVAAVAAMNAAIEASDSRLGVGMQGLIKWLFGVLLLATGVAAHASAPSNLLFVLDGSGSMWGQIKGEAKISIARRLMHELVDGLEDDGRHLGLIAYGHRRESDCSDIENLIPLKAMDKPAIKAAIDQIKPKGKTPITASIDQAFGLLGEKPATVVLLTDGLETCNADPCARVQKARQDGQSFVMHVIGFDVAKEDVSQLECAAQAGGGLFLSADNADELDAALQTAVEMDAEAIPDGKLSVKVTANGQAQDALVHVFKAGADELVGKGRTYTGAKTNPRVIPLQDGKYRVRVRAVGISGSPEQTLHVEIAGEPQERTVDFSSGALSIRVTRNGALSDAGYFLRAPGEKKDVARGRTYRGEKTNPATATVPAGRYELFVKSIEIKSADEIALGSVHIKPGETVAMEHEFVSGELKIGATANGALVDAVVSIKSADGTSVGGGRTYTGEKTNPKSFTLLPGTYGISVQQIRGDKKTFELEVKAAETTLQVVDFSQ
ncbi:MAG: vWA domain-containing protein [Panacagrimonas sp.]